MSRVKTFAPLKPTTMQLQWPEHPYGLESITRLVGHHVAHNWDNLRGSVLYKLFASVTALLEFGVLIEIPYPQLRIESGASLLLTSHLICRNITYNLYRVAHLNEWLWSWLSVLARMIHAVGGINKLKRCSREHLKYCRDMAIMIGLNDRYNSF